MTGSALSEDLGLQAPKAACMQSPSLHAGVRPVPSCSLAVYIVISSLIPSLTDLLIHSFTRLSPHSSPPPPALIHSLNEFLLFSQALFLVLGVRTEVGEVPALGTPKDGGEKQARKSAPNTILCWVFTKLQRHSRQEASSTPAQAASKGNSTLLLTIPLFLGTKGQTKPCLPASLALPLTWGYDSTHPTDG